MQCFKVLIKFSLVFFFYENYEPSLLVIDRLIVIDIGHTWPFMVAMEDKFSRVEITIYVAKTQCNWNQIKIMAISIA